MFSQPATLELTHNWEHEPGFRGYHSGNQEPKGYGVSQTFQFVGTCRSPSMPRNRTGYECRMSVLKVFAETRGKLGALNAGHIGLAVPDVEAACKRFEELGVEFVKKPNDGSMKGLAFIKVGAI